MDTNQLEQLITENLPDVDVDSVLSSLNKGQMAELVRLSLETERRKKQELIRYYKPYADTGYQLDFHRSLKKRRGVLGSNRSGKTTVDVAEVDWWATGTHPYRETPPPPVRIRVCCTDFKSGIEKVMIPKFQEFVIRERLRGKSWESAYSKEQRTLYYENGSFVEFMSYDQDVEKFGGTSRHLIIEDEPSPYEIHNENMARLVDTNGELIMSMTPVNLGARTAYIYDLWMDTAEGKDPEWEWFFFDIFKNKALSKEYVQKFADSIKDEGERIARIEGKFPRLVGLVYKKFSRGKHIIEPREIPLDWSIYLGIDPHPRMDTGIVFIAVDRDENKYVFDEILEKASAKVLVDKIKQKLGGRKIVMGVMDNSGGTDNVLTGEPSAQDEFLDPDRNRSDKGIFTHLVSNKEKAVRAGIRLVDDHLGLDEVYQKPRLFVFANCVKTIHEFETYIWDDYKNRLEKPLMEKPRKIHDHLMDGIRYALMSNPYYVKANLWDHSNEPVYHPITGDIIG